MAKLISTNLLSAIPFKANATPIITIHFVFLLQRTSYRVPRFRLHAVGGATQALNQFHGANVSGALVGL